MRKSKTQVQTFEQREYFALVDENGNVVIELMAEEKADLIEYIRRLSSHNIIPNLATHRRSGYDIKPIKVTIEV